MRYMKKLLHSPSKDYTDEEVVEIFRTKLALRRAEETLRNAKKEWKRLLNFGETRGTSALRTHQLFKRAIYERRVAKKRVFAAQCAYARAVEGPAARRALIANMAGMIQDRLKEESFAPKILSTESDLSPLGQLAQKEK